MYRILPLDLSCQLMPKITFHLNMRDEMADSLLPPTTLTQPVDPIDPFPPLRHDLFIEQIKS